MTTKPAVLALIRARHDEILADEHPVLGPFPHMCVCGAPRWEHQGALNTGKHKPAVGDPNGCKRWAEDKIEAAAWRAIEAFDRKLVRDYRHWESENSEREPLLEGQLRVRPSDTSTCKRQVWYRNFTPEGLVRDPVDQRAAAIGTMIHDAVTKSQTALYPWLLAEQRVKIPGLDREGRYDLFDPITGMLIDIKSAGRYKWDKIGDDGPDEDTWDQGFIYGLALSRAGFEVRVIRLWYVNRESGSEEFFDRPYDEAVAVAALSRLTSLIGVLEDYRDAVADGDDQYALTLIPEREGRRIESFPCSYCPFRSHCWDVKAATAHGRSPESWTMLGPSPEDKAIETVLVEYDDARRQESEGKNRKSDAKALLDGIEHGTYGDMILSSTAGSSANMRAYQDALREAWNTPEGFRPDFDSIPVPKTTYSSISVRPVRAAKRAARAKGAAK